MSGNIADEKIAKQIEQAIRQLDCLWILPGIASSFLSKLIQMQLSPAELAEIAESDPAFTTWIFALARKQGLNFSKENFSVRCVLEKLPLRVIRDAFLSARIYEPDERNLSKVSVRKQLTIYAMAVACCAEDIARIASAKIDAKSAYLAGLLHNVGNLAMDQMMPKSFDIIIDEANAQKISLSEVQQRRFGLDYTIIGKRLAQNWHLPNEIATAIWLHRGNVAFSQTVPDAKIAAVIKLADCVVRQCGIWQSGDYDIPDLPASAAQTVGITAEQLEQIQNGLAERVAEKSKIAGLDLPDSMKEYYASIRNAAAQLAQDNTKLSTENRRLQKTSGYFDFTQELLSGINPFTEPIEVAQNLAAGWQKFYQTGMAAVCLAPDANSQVIEMVLVERPTQSKTLVVNMPCDTAFMPAEANFAILNAAEHVGWIFDQLDVDFDLGCTRLVPLLCDGKTVGAVVFEFRYPVESEQVSESFKTIAAMAASILEISINSQKQQHFAEQFSQFLAKSKDSRVETANTNIKQPISPTTAVMATEKELQSEKCLHALTEMAAGAAHELNNPLFVISGRAQLLADAETDPEKKRILTIIQENAHQLSQIIDGLMSFAQPPETRPEQTEIRQIIDEAIELASQKTHAEHINAQIEIADGTSRVYVDSAQIASAVANVLSNSLESYNGQLGPVKIATINGDKGYVRLEISDLGCGMDADTLAKATHPFFSGKAAGRKRGMGLAYTNRLVHLNGGSLDIESEPGKGTTVRIALPKGE